jgi:hypothetical protein
MNAPVKPNWMITAGSIAACGMPLVYYCYVFVFWLLASAALGHWVEPGANDPKGFFFGLPAIIGVVLMLMSFAVAPFVIGLGLMRRKIVAHVVAYAVCLGLSIWLFRSDFLLITTWIAD